MNINSKPQRRRRVNFGGKISLGTNQRMEVLRVNLEKSEKKKLKDPSRGQTISYLYQEGLKHLFTGF